MTLSEQQSQQLYGTVSYTGWGEDEAAADAAAKGLSGSGDSTYQGYFDQISGDVNKYADELIDIAQGDYDFVAKWIENAYKLALGTDDVKRAEFMKKVANATEERQGRIIFDYDQGMYRLEEDTSRALGRLAEDEKFLTEKLGAETALEREQQAGDLNRMGLVTGPREEEVGLGGKRVRELEENIGRRELSLARSVGRGREDITRASERGIEDITTQARRGAIDEETSTAYAREKAKRDLDRQKKLAEIQRYGGLQSASGIAKEQSLWSQYYG